MYAVRRTEPGEIRGEELGLDPVGDLLPKPCFVDRTGRNLERIKQLLPRGLEAIPLGQIDSPDHQRAPPVPVPITHQARD
jgi:hypothetical protein